MKFSLVCSVVLVGISHVLCQGGGGGSGTGGSAGGNVGSGTGTGTGGSAGGNVGSGTGTGGNSGTGTGSSGTTTALTQLEASQTTFSTFLNLARNAGLTNTLNSTGNFTVFAPTNQAFSSLPSPLISLLQLSTFSAITRAILDYHIANGAYYTANITSSSPLTVTSQLSNLPLILTGNSSTSTYYVNGAQIVRPDLAASNGVVQGINSVLTPAGLLSSSFGNLGGYLSPAANAAMMLLPSSLPSTY